MKKKTFYLAQAAVIAAIYVVLILLFQPLSFGEVQVRIAEALTILPFFTPAAIPGVAIGCFLGNLIGGGNVMDLIFGTLATLIGAAGSYAVRRNKYLVPLPPILSNVIIIPWVLKYAYELPFSIPFMMATVGLGEVISCGVLGLILLTFLKSCRGISWNPYKA
ncbi:MAG: QueT transporter family protein [Lachnospiraceae bacterium]|nr:QueT transporter family protein [Lachnospiraceae bacterium]